ncbi:MAG TPA: hypothetical protein VG889_14505 [Rhizomicrobium sp.]|nr:hypothetical protein [Rhizomicrobium sp.]
MADTSSKDAARKRAQNHFAVAERRDSLVKQMIASERAAVDAKTAKLRVLRLAKEAVDREAALNVPPPSKAKKSRRAAVRPATPSRDTMPPVVGPTIAPVEAA